MMYKVLVTNEPEASYLEVADLKLSSTRKKLRNQAGRRVRRCDCFVARVVSWFSSRSDSSDSARSRDMASCFQLPFALV